ncbi:lysosomal thioesterase PPT2-A-like [Pholidichthys leucotaenia]
MKAPVLFLLHILLLLLSADASVEGYKPVILVHGIFSEPKRLQTLSNYITKLHPGTQVTAVNLFNNKESLRPLWTQVEGFRKVIEPLMREAANGVHLICFSQGGLICRALLATTPDHNVDTFISLSSPQAGQYGVTDYVTKIFPYCVRKSIYKFCYKTIGQEMSICNYWNDPHHHSRYLRKNSFLPVLDGETPNNNNVTTWRDNFLRLKKLVLIGGPDDGVITPWQSSHFGFYNSRDEVVEMKDQEFYRKDSFGLKTLDARGDIWVCVRSGVKHVQWHSNFTIFQSCMEKWLT